MRAGSGPLQGLLRRARLLIPYFLVTQKKKPLLRSLMLGEGLLLSHESSQKDLTVYEIHYDAMEPFNFPTF